MEDGDELTYDSSAYEMYHAVSDLFPLNACSNSLAIAGDCYSVDFNSCNLFLFTVCMHLNIASLQCT